MKMVKITGVSSIHAPLPFQGGIVLTADATDADRNLMRRVDIDGDLIVTGNLNCGTTSKLQVQIAGLQSELAKVKNQLKEACDRLEECYYAPGAPGANIYRQHFEQLKVNPSWMSQCRERKTVEKNSHTQAAVTEILLK